MREEEQEFAPGQEARPPFAQSSVAANLQGPWKARWSVDGDFFAVYPDTGRNEFPIASKPQFLRQDFWEQYARLIAAAPDLLSSLCNAPCFGCGVRFGDNSDEGRKQARGCVSCTAARAAIAKAEGRS